MLYEQGQGGAQGSQGVPGAVKPAGLDQRLVRRVADGEHAVLEAHHQLRYPAMLDDVPGAHLAQCQALEGACGTLTARRVRVLRQRRQ